MKRMDRLSRRGFFGLAGAVGVGTLGLGACAPTASAKARVVVVGGGFGGATAARQLRQIDPAIRVTLVEPSASFVTCPFSNEVLGGLRPIDSITHGYQALAERHGVEVLHDRAVAIDPVKKTVTLGRGGALGYDRLILSPGIDLRWNAIAGYDEAAAEKMPHAWKAGPQTLLLRRQLEAMPDGGVVLISAPANPFRCPPGPYERASLIAHYLRQAKPRSKILILDAKDAFSKQPLFQDGWKALYANMIEWVPLSKDGKVVRVMPDALTLESEFGEKHKGAVVNVIPPQFAASIARDAGLADTSGWCPVDPVTFESTKVKDIHVIGDAAIAGAMPKSGFAANSQGKVVARAVASLLSGQAPAAPVLVNTCYSLLAPDYGISVADVYKVTAKGITAVEGAGGVSPRQADAQFRYAEAHYGEGWYLAMSREIWDS